jgi:hypothetical protein
MRTTVDKAGRLVIPKPLRDQLGLGPGEVDTSVAVVLLTSDHASRTRFSLQSPAGASACPAMRRTKRIPS